MIFECDRGHRFLYYSKDKKKFTDCPVCGGFSLPDGWQKGPYWNDNKEVK